MDRFGKSSDQTESSVREKAAENMQNGDYLMRQIDDVRDRARQLQDMMDTREDMIAELDRLVSEREGKAKDLDTLLQARKDESERLIRVVTDQIQQMIESLDRKMAEFDSTIRGQVQRIDEGLDGNLMEVGENIDDQLGKINRQVVSHLDNMGQQMDSQLESMNGQLGGHLDGMDKKVDIQLEEFDKKVMDRLEDVSQNISHQMSGLDETVTEKMSQTIKQTEMYTEMIQTAVNEMKEAMENLKNDIFEKIHTEDVKCYRDIKDLLEQQAEYFSQTELSDKGLERVRGGFKGVRFLSAFALIDCILIIIGFLFMSGILRF